MHILEIVSLMLREQVSFKFCREYVRTSDLGLSEN